MWDRYNRYILPCQVQSKAGCRLGPRITWGPVPGGPVNAACRKCNNVLEQQMDRLSVRCSLGLDPEGHQAPPMADPSCGSEEAPFEAALVFTDPVDWYRDLQLLTDVIMSGRRRCQSTLSLENTHTCLIQA